MHPSPTNIHMLEVIEVDAEVECRKEIEAGVKESQVRFPRIMSRSKS